MITLDTIANFQNKLMDLFSKASSVDEALLSLKSDPSFAPFSEWILTWNPDMIGVAMTVTRTWSVTVTRTWSVGIDSNGEGL